MFPLRSAERENSAAECDCGTGGKRKPLEIKKAHRSRVRKTNRTKTKACVWAVALYWWDGVNSSHPSYMVLGLPFAYKQEKKKGMLAILVVCYNNFKHIYVSSPSHSIYTTAGSLSHWLWVRSHDSCWEESNPETGRLERCLIVQLLCRCS